MMEKIAILGSTGSIGVNTLRVVASLKNRFKVTALAADSNVKLLAQQARLYKPKIISVGSAELAHKIKSLLPGGIRIVYGREGLNEAASHPDADLAVMAISGMSCISPLVEAIRHKKRIALANKESIVSAGSVITKLAKKNNVKIIPVDSEHSAIFQCLENRRQHLSKIYLTGSGGPLLKIDRKKFDSLPRSFILKHPRWSMGPKISVDSATMMNKALEIIEARYLFDVDEQKIEVLIHPEAIIHSMVELADNTVFAQLGVPDMKAPIQYALTYPARTAGLTEKIDFSKTGKLSFLKPDTGKFPCLGLASSALKAGGLQPAVLCASDEEAVKYYLDGKIKFTDIYRIIEKVLSRNKNNLKKEPTIEDIFQAEEWAREEARSFC